MILFIWFFKIQFYISSSELSLFGVPRCSAMFRDVPCSWFSRPPISWPEIIQVVASFLHNAILAYFTFSFRWFSISAYKALASIPNNMSGLRKAQVSWDLTHTDYKYVQIITMFTPSANFNQSIAGRDEDCVERNNRWI